MNGDTFFGLNREIFPLEGVMEPELHSLSNPSANGSANPLRLRTFALNSARNGDYSEAIALLSQLILHYPQNAIDYNNRGLIYFQSGDAEKAFCDYNAALNLNPHLVSAYNNRANYYAAQGELIEAIADYDRALDINPSYVRAWINRGITLRDLELYEEAIDNFEVALLFSQLQTHILAERGRTYHLWGDWNCAIADYHRALELIKPSDTANKRLRNQIKTWLNDLLAA